MISSSRPRSHTSGLRSNWYFRSRILLGGKVRHLFIRRPIQWLLDGICGSVAVLLAFHLRFDLYVPDIQRHSMWLWFGLLFFLTPFVIGVRGGYRSSWQHFGLYDVGMLAVRLGVLSGGIIVAILATPEQHAMPYGVLVMDFLISLTLTSTVRAARRLDHQALNRMPVDDRILVVATESTVSRALNQLLPLYGKAICGIALVDGPAEKHSSVSGVPILDLTPGFQFLLLKHEITLLFLCSAEITGLEDLMEATSECGVDVKLLPSVEDLLQNRVRVSKHVLPTALAINSQIADAAMHEAVAACFDGETVLITGAAGSIGSELARQVAASNATKLLLLDQDENGIFELIAEMEGRKGLVPVIADIRESDAMRAIMAREKPSIVLHAAAYKHVPLMEAHPCEAILNNVIGTRNIAEAAIEFNVKRMVMISSDKAVRPTSVMGATKRVAEIVTQNLAEKVRISGSGTQFACVRFGNVLGSRGSVLPIFLRQIAQGKPLTITDEQMTRYFMTIPQAVRLVLQAATLASSGHIYMLDMGDPKKILTLARQVIQLAGLTPGKDIEIRVTGRRPGEKLHEQLWNEDAEVRSTMFQHVFEVRASGAPADFDQTLEHLAEIAREHSSDEALSQLAALPIDYRPERLLKMEAAKAEEPLPAAI